MSPKTALKKDFDRISAVYGYNIPTHIFTGDIFGKLRLLTTRARS
jgi:hypothetical protein